MDKIDSTTASNPGPVPPSQVLSRTAGKKREVRTPVSRIGNETAVEIATDKTERPYRQTAGATRRKPGSDFDILLTPKAYSGDQAGKRLTIRRSARHSSSLPQKRHCKIPRLLRGHARALT